MATARGDRAASLIDERFARPGSFDFFQAVRQLEIHQARDGSFRAVGEDNPPERECVRFVADPSLAFAPADVAGLERREGGGPPVRMEVAFLGLVGTAGVLPQPYSALVIERLQLRDTTLRDWMDLFHHRLVSLYYRAWTKYRFPFAYERARREHGGEDPFTRALFSLTGRGLASQRSRDGVDDSFLAFLGGHFARRVRTAAGLARALSDSLGVPVRVEEFVGRWLDIPDDERCTLRADPGRGAERVQLGRGATLGARVWDVCSKVRIHLGPMSLTAYRHLRPGGAGAAALAAVVREYLGSELDHELRFELGAGESPGTRLQARGRTGPGSALGLDAWVESDMSTPGPRTAPVPGGLRRGRSR